MIEVCTEASLQPILQLYLFLLSLLCSNDLYSTCINLWTIVQILSFLSSVLSVPRTFTQRYALNQNGMMSLESKAAYFLFSLSGVVSRILSFQLIAFLSRKFWLIYAFVGAHVVLISIINLTFVKLGKSTKKQESKEMLRTLPYVSWSPLRIRRRPSTSLLTSIFLPLRCPPL